MNLDWPLQDLPPRPAEPKPPDDICVVVSSCDKYRDVWHQFFTLFFRYWHDCPFPVYLVSNFEAYPNSRVSTIKVGRDRNWSSVLASGLRKISKPRVLLMLEDFLLDRAVDTKRICGLADYMQLRRAASLRLCPTPGPNIFSQDNPEVGEISKGADYRLSLQAAIWDRRVLLSLMRWGETPWELELLGSRRTDSLDAPFLSSRRDLPNGPPIHYCMAVAEGRWLPQAVNLCEKEGIPIDTRVRPLEEQEQSRNHVQERRVSRKTRALRRLWRRP
jgi:hypothetical protein